ncbi:MAG: pentapeptide repeat-containing protein [Gordonia sp. (in: high G+C Gram-positive bacteria)]
MTEYLNFLAAVLALVAGLAGLAGVVRIRTRRATLSLIGASFAEIARGLGSSQQIERLTSAALLPRFFDTKSEYALKGAPYAADAIKLGAAVLKSEPTGVVQKTIADALARASSLSRVDFQRANLRNAYWGSRGPERGVDVEGSDFYRADLTGASLRGVDARGAVFKRAQLVGSVLDGARLQGCDFSDANLKNCSFEGALLLGARFDGASGVPASVLDGLDAEGRYASAAPVQPIGRVERGAVTEVRVFLSKPSTYGSTGDFIEAQIRSGVAAAEARLVTFPPEEYGVAAPLEEVKHRMTRCDAVIVMGVPQYEAEALTWRAGTPEERRLTNAVLATPWNHIEAGMAAALDKPLLVVSRHVEEGVFEVGEQPHAVRHVDVGTARELSNLENLVRAWLEDVR